MRIADGGLGIHERHAVEEGRGLSDREAQIGRPDFGQLIAGAQAGKRQRRIGAGEHDQAHLRRQMIQQERERLVDRPAGDRVAIVQDERERPSNFAQLVDQAGEDGLGRGRLRGLQQPQRDGAEAPLQRAERGDEIGEKARRIVVALIQREPGHAGRGAGGQWGRRAGESTPYNLAPFLLCGLLQPFRHQRCLAKPRGRGDQREGAGQSLRAEIQRSNAWRARLDATTHWAVLVADRAISWQIARCSCLC